MQPDAGVETQAVTAIDGTISGTHPGSLRRAWFSVGWVFFLLAVFIIYSNSFNVFPEIGRRHDVLADADMASYMLLVQDFELSREYGNKYALEGRTAHDIAQKHKIHHILYVGFASLIYSVLDPAYRALGISSNQVFYSINAFIVCINLVLFSLLLRHFNHYRNPEFPFIILYAAALSTWIYASVLDSWPFSLTLTLGFLVLRQKARVPYVVQAVLIGFGMLNNVTLASLLFFVLLDRFRETHSVRALVRSGAVSVVVTFASWALFLTALSVFDEGFRPDRFVAYTVWFKENLSFTLPVYSLYMWESVVTNLFINSVTSSQPDPRVPQEALLFTIRGGGLGVVATLLYVALLGVSGFRALRAIRDSVQQGGGMRGILANDSLDLLAYSVLWIFITAFLHYAGAFLYAVLVTPLMLISISRFIDLRRRASRMLFYSALAAIVVVNIDQIRQFREALTLMP